MSVNSTDGFKLTIKKFTSWQEPLSTELENKRKSIDKRLMWSNSKYTSQYQIYITLQVYKICKGIYISTIKRKTLNKKEQNRHNFRVYI